MISECVVPPALAIASLAVAVAALLGVSAIAVFVLATVAVVQPLNPSPRDHTALLARQPSWVFWLVSYLLRLAALLSRCKPAPLRVAEVAVSYIHSQALFALVNLGLPEVLLAGPPKTPQQLADLVRAKTGADVRPEWLARVLKLAAELGLVTRRRVQGLLPAAPHSSEAASSTTSPAATASQHCAASSDDGLKPAPAATLAGAFNTGYSCRDLYSANAVTAVLCREHPNCMADFVKLMGDHFAPFSCLSEGMARGAVPFELWSGGRCFWDHLAASPRHATTFDGAMRACNHTGAKMAVEQYPWNRYDVVVDIGGGNGQFLAELLAKHTGLQGVLVDQQGQVTRGKQWWGQEFGALLPRVEFVVGDMFQPSTLPRPRPGRRTLYVLKQILHDWSDADSLTILAAIRAVISDQDVAAGAAFLAVLETGAMKTVTPALLQHRLEADLTMLMSFGDGKERDERQMGLLLEAAGFTPGRLLPTTGLMTIQEAAPAPRAAGHVGISPVLAKE